MIVPYTTLGKEDGCEELCAEAEGGLCGAAEKIVAENGTAGEDFGRL